MESDQQELGVVGLFEMFMGSSVEEVILMFLTLIAGVGIYFYVVYQSRKGAKLGIKGADKIYLGMLGSILVTLVSSIIIYINEEMISDRTFSLLNYGSELVSFILLAYAAIGFRDLVIGYQDQKN